MGLFSFIKDKGEKLFDGDDAEERAARERTEKVREKAFEAREGRREELLVERLRDFGLTDEVGVVVDGDRVTVNGTVESQEEREKVVLALGNVTGISTVDDQLELAGADETGEATFYTVQAGDTLWEIAEGHYGDGSKYERIFEANRPLLDDPDEIYPGQTLRIPDA